MSDKYELSKEEQTSIALQHIFRFQETFDRFPIGEPNHDSQAINSLVYEALDHAICALGKNYKEPQ